LRARQDLSSYCSRTLKGRRRRYSYSFNCLSVFKLLRKDKSLKVSVKMEITGKGYYQYGKDTRVREDYFSKISLTNQEDTTLTFWMMSCSWWEETLIFDRDSMEFSASGCDKNIPVKVALKPGKSLIVYPVIHANSKKINQVRIGFVLMKEEELNNHFADRATFLKIKNVYWSNPVSLEYRNNGYRMEE